ncbi:MAG: hypothetical protein Q8O89_09180, partial [Nanoarchaeota archaeon]|nr:hypothetical protein [Nanoarchaeota archaeon]
MVKLAYEGLKGPNSGELEAIAVSESAKYSAISESYDKGVIDYKYSNSAFKALEQKYAASGKKMESEYRQLVDILEGKSHSSYQKGYRENWNSRLKKFNNELREITGSYELDLQQKQEIEGLLNNSYLDKAIKSNKKHSKSNEFLRAWAVSYVNGIYSPEKTEAKTKGLDDKVSNVVSKEDSNQQDDIRKKPVVQKPTIRKPTFDKPTYHKPTYHKPTNADGPCENNNQQQTYARPVLTNSKPVCGNTTVSDTTTPVLKPIPPAYPVTYPAYHDDRFSNHANSENSGDSNDFDFLTGSSDLEAIVSSQETNGNGKKPYVPFMDRAVKAIAKPLIYIVTLSMLLTGAGGTAKNNAIDKELNRPELIEQYKGDNPTYTSASAGENNLYLDLRSHKNDSETDANNNAQNNNKNNDSDRNNSNENNENLNNSDKDPASAVQAVPTNQYQRTARPAQNRYPAYASAKEVPAIMAGNNAGNNVDSANVAVAAAPVYQAPQIANPNYETGNATDNATGTVQVDAQQGNTVPQVYVPKVQAYQAPTNNVPAADNTAANNIAANNAVADNIGANPSANDSVTKTYGGRAITFVDASAASTTDASANSDNPNLENIVDANTISGKTADANQAA